MPEENVFFCPSKHVAAVALAVPFEAHFSGSSKPLALNTFSLPTPTQVLP